jgi:intracellular sulfur oxidation DsrE/DsrF family protein
MNIRSKRTITVFLFSMMFFLVVVPPGSTEGYESLKGIASVNTIFDFRDGIPERALIHIKLIHETYMDKAIRAVTDKPEFVVVFMDSSVKLLSQNRAGFSAEEKKMLEEFDQVITAMSKDGVRLEICMFAGNVFGVDPSSLPKELIHVPNGWIASIGYQEKGYSLVPVY